MNPDWEYLAAGLALGGLDDDDRARATELYASEPGFRAAVRDHEAALVDLDSAEALEPSGEARAAILSIPRNHPQAASGPHPEPSPVPDTQDDPTPAVRPGLPPIESTTERRTTGDDASAGGRVDAGGVDELARWRRRARAGWLTAAAAAVAVILAGGSAIYLGTERDTATDQLQAQEVRSENLSRLLDAEDFTTRAVEVNDGGTLRVAFSESEQVINVTTDMQAPADRSLQMWVIDPAGPRSAGLMTEGETLLTGAAFDEGDVFGVTVEPEGGSPAPTSDPVATAVLSAEE